ncbi:hypothetical protein [Pedobacter nutrimenti]|uniref:Uncharacterized protein n=1 Tax=Pedobacter nutrimenti TaxID=1241337 RepID=A0A318UAE3_9SPHI|nr:hypothetical protein [Pedobacter nutrimenti]PYF71485.1 hypothetical protein B0O44_107100 [Pedobacter nutrimenti]
MELLSRNFLNSIVWVGDFELDYKEVNLNVLCIEDGDTEVHYLLRLSDIVYFFYRQEDFEHHFSVIDVFLERFNDCREVRTRHSEQMQDYWMLQLYSGIHQALIGFKELNLSIIKTS